MLAAAQAKVNNAGNIAIQKRFQEYRLLLQIGESGGDITQLDPSTALTLARLARDTLASEYDLARSKLDACHKELVVLQDSVDEALVFLTDGDHQVGRILNILSSARAPIPTHPLPFSSPNPTFERPDHLFCHPMEEESSDSEDSLCTCDNGGRSPSDFVIPTPMLL